MTSVLTQMDTDIDLTEPEIRYEHEIVVFECTVFKAAKFMDWIQIHCSFTRQKRCWRAPRLPDEKRKNKKKEERGGSDIYHCEHGGLPRPIRKDAKRVKGSKRCGCNAKVTINFPHKYQHDSNGNLNVHEHGDKIVKVTWHWEHNHSIRSLKNFYNSRLSKKVKHIIHTGVSIGLSWRTIKEKIEYDEANWNDGLPPCFSKLPYFQVYNIRRKIFWDLCTRDSCLNVSLKKWAKEINKKGFSEFKDESDFLKEYPEETELKTNTGESIWSFSLMSQWQSKVLKRDGETFYLDSTPCTCYGFDKSENVYLFTLLVKNSITGEGCPVGFLITNSKKQLVIADFLTKVKKYCPFEPSRVAIDCDVSEKNALKSVWPGIKIVSCYWNVMRTFGTNAHSEKNGLDYSPSPDHLKHANDEFRKIFCTTTIEDVQKNINIFIEKHKDNLQLTRIVEKQWLKELEQFTGNYGIRSSETYNYIESWHKKLESCISLAGRKQRPDFLIYQDFVRVDRDFQTEEIKVKTGGAFRINDKGEKAAFAKADELSVEDFMRMVISWDKRIFSVKSFSLPNVTYLVTLLTPDKTQATCSCPYWLEGNSWCKHIFLTFRWSQRKNLELDQVSCKESVKNTTSPLVGDHSKTRMTCGIKMSTTFHGSPSSLTQVDDNVSSLGIPPTFSPPESIEHINNSASPSPMIQIENVADLESEAGTELDADLEMDTNEEIRVSTTIEENGFQASESDSERNSCIIDSRSLDECGISGNSMRSELSPNSFNLNQPEMDSNEVLHKTQEILKKNQEVHAKEKENFDIREATETRRAEKREFMEETRESKRKQVDHMINCFKQRYLNATQKEQNRLFEKFSELFPDYESDNNGMQKT